MAAVTQTVSDRLQHFSNGLIDEAVAHEDAIIVAGKLAPDDYRYRSGMRAGLLKAKDLIDQALRDIMKG